MAEVHLDHPGDWFWFGGKPAPVVGPCPHTNCPHDRTRGLAYGPDYEHYVLDECVVREDAGGCGGQCRGWFAEWPPDEGPDGRRWREVQVWMQVDVRAAALRDGGAE